MEEVQKTIEEEINPMLQIHNGSCEAVSLEDGVLSIRLLGGCAGCPASRMTLANLVFPILQNNHENILTEIILVV